jgi:carboxyl-terminal processing protease
MIRNASTYKNVLFKTANLLFLLVFVWLMFTACSDVPFDPDPEKPVHDSLISENQHIYNIFKEWYLWEEHLPELDPDTFATAALLVDALRYKTYDRWSYTTSNSELQKYLANSSYFGLGAGFATDLQGKLKISRVYAQSPMAQVGVTRGWQIDRVNNVEAVNYQQISQIIATSSTLNFEMTDLDQKQHQLTVSKANVSINTVLHSQIIQSSAGKIAYLVFDSFLQKSANELTKVFETFKNEKVKYLIVDLRYNGGGLVNISEYMVGLIGGDKVKGKLITSIVHNNNKRAMNKSTTLKTVGPSANTANVYFITSGQTASASEIVINSLLPYMPVITVGGATHGKPVGMHIKAVSHYDLAVVPISFLNQNASGNGNYFGGIPATITATDQLAHNWGSLDEPMLKTAIDHIEGNLAIAPSELKSSSFNNQFEYIGLNKTIGAY